MKLIILTGEEYDLFHEILELPNPQGFQFHIKRYSVKDRLIEIRKQLMKG